MSKLQMALMACTLVALSPAILSAQERFPENPRGMYSDAVRVGDLVFMSGVVGLESDPTEQFRSIFRRIERILENAGSSLEQVVDLTTYHVDMHDHIDEFMAVKAEFLPNLPTWTAVGVTELYLSEAKVEVKIIAAATSDP